ncbi:hypothetical protein L915_06064 [Phytophthora nicotianae]|nr:hypothetical protein L915_06064 [Phytophthora nicotianae]ETL43488.1 hypothetical protein L916_06002 [Phytophthora nicotianae]
MVEWLKGPTDFNIMIGKKKTSGSDRVGFGRAHTKLSWLGKMSENVFISCVKTFIDQGEPIPAKYPVKWDAHTWSVQQT